MRKLNKNFLVAQWDTYICRLSIIFLILFGFSNLIGNEGYASGAGNFDIPQIEDEFNQFDPKSKPVHEESISTNKKEKNSF